MLKLSTLFISELIFLDYMTDEVILISKNFYVITKCNLLMHTTLMQLKYKNEIYLIKFNKI